MSNENEKSGACSCARSQAPLPPKQEGGQVCAFWPVVGVVGALVLWIALYSQLQVFAEAIASLFPLEPGSRLREAVLFFFYDTPKVLLLVVLIVFAMGVLRSFFSPDHVRALLARRREGVGNVAAACLGVLTPFCSCSAVPLFIGFVSAGIPLGVTFSFLIAAPMVNEVALGLLFGLVGWRAALAYLLFGLLIAIVAGRAIGLLHLESWLESWVRAVRSEVEKAPAVQLNARQRIGTGLEAVHSIVGQVWGWMVLGIACGALIHGYVPSAALAEIMGRDAWWSVPAAVLMGVPMYANAAGLIPVVEALLGKGAALGTTLAFMMAVVGLSFPEMVILRKVLTIRLLAVFIGVVTTGILVVGYLFNLIFG